MLNTTPNHHMLNAISNNHLGQMSVLIKFCQHGNTSNGSAPVISFNIPNNVFYLSKPPAVVPIMPIQGTTPSLVTPIALIPALCYWNSGLHWSCFRSQASSWRILQDVPSEWWCSKQIWWGWLFRYQHLPIHRMEGSQRSRAESW